MQQSHLEAICKKIDKGIASSEEKQIAADWIRYQRISSFKDYCLYMIPTFTWHWFHFYIMDRIQAALDAGCGKIIIEMPPRHGKMLRNSDRIKTKYGWTTHGQIQVGQIIDSGLGKFTRVIGVYPQGLQPLYRVTFADGRYCDAGLDHLWHVESSRFKGKPRILSTQELIELKKNTTLGARLFVPRYAPVKNSADVLLPIHPYLLGILLGNGNFIGDLTITSRDEYILNKCIELLMVCKCELKRENESRYSIVGAGLQKFKKILIDLNLWGKNTRKISIPLKYLEASYNQRVYLLQGLMDTDGWTSKQKLEFCTVSQQLSLNMQLLVRSLGGLCDIVVRIIRIGIIVYYLRIKHNERTLFFTLPRKLSKCRDCTKENYRKYNNGLRIASIDYIGRYEATCIMVDDPAHLYVTNDYIVTHNTLIAGELLCSYYFGRYPERRIIYGTYNEVRAKSFVNDNLIPCITSDKYIGLFDSRIKWNDDLNKVETKQNKATNLSFSNTKSNRGAFLAAGRGNAMTGEPGNLIIIDDPVKDYAEVRSPIVRQSTYDWYSSVVETRLEDNNLQLLFSTRWHSDDLIGRIKKINEQNTDPDFLPWEIITFAAQKESIHITNEYDKRMVQEYLVPSKKSIYATQKKDPKKWNALFQQKPLDEEGMLFQRSYISWYHTLPEEGVIWISIDPNKKVTATSDYIGITIWLIKYVDNSRNQYYLLEFIEEKHNFNNLLKRIDALCIKYKPFRGHAPNILIEVDNGQGLFEMARDKHPNTFPFETKTASKFERAQIFMTQCSAGNIFMPTPEINANIEYYISEWLQFTGENGGKDNLVDSSSQLIVHHDRRVVYLPTNNFLDEKNKIKNDYMRHFGNKHHNIIQPYLRNANNGRY